MPLFTLGLPATLKDGDVNRTVLPFAISAKARAILPSRKRTAVTNELSSILVFVEAPKLTAQSLHTICGGSGTGIAYEQLGIGGYNGYAYYPVY